MDRITLKNFRCFREEQSARLAPLTLLVGENSTGKTSFMAMIRLGLLALAEHIVDQRFRMYLLLNEKRRRLNYEVGPVLHVLAAPDELRVEVAVTPLVRDLNRVLIFFGKQRLILGGRDVLPRRLTVGEILNCFDSSGASRRSCHVFLRAVLLFKRSYFI